MKHVVGRVALHSGRLPRGKFLGIIEQPQAHGYSGPVVSNALMLITEQTLNEEVMRGDPQGDFVCHVRTGQPITEDQAEQIGEYLGSIGETHYFINRQLNG